jgi:hypothetical protein
MPFSWHVIDAEIWADWGKIWRLEICSPFFSARQNFPGRAEKKIKE